MGTGGQIGAIISGAVCLILTAVGLYFWIRLRAFPVVRLRVIVRGLFRQRKAEGISPFHALSVALAGTLGVGNIVGVATAIRAGGAGALFWMWVSSLLSVMLKYAEVVLAMQYRRRTDDGLPYGGAVYYLQTLRFGREIAPLFAVFVIGASFVIGNAVQTNAAATALYTAFRIPPLVTGGAIFLLTAWVTVGGAKRVSQWTGKLIPLLAGGFFLLSLAAVIRGGSGLPAVFSRILREAFSISAAAGGVGGSLLARGIRYGVTRGLLSNEAGCGTAPTAHAAAEQDSAVEQGFFGIFEVFADALLCTVTGLVLLLATEATGDGMEFAGSAYQLFFGAWAEKLLSLAVFCFALATVIGWSYYGTEAVSYCRGGSGSRRAYQLVYSALSVAAAVIAPCRVLLFADLAVSVLTILNSAALFSKRKEVVQATEVYLHDCKVKTGRGSSYKAGKAGGAKTPPAESSRS